MLSDFSITETKDYLWDFCCGIYNNSLHRNSFFLMASTGVMAVVGFFFWIVASHLYSPAQVGLGSSLTSLAGLLISLAGLGLPPTLIRFLPTSKQKNLKISTALMLAMITTFLVSVIFWFGSKIWLSQIHTLIASPIAWIFFTLALLVGAWQDITDSVFVAYGKAEWVFIQSIIFSIFKVLFAVGLVAFGGYALFISHFAAVGLAIALGFFVLIKQFKLQLIFKISGSILRQVAKYSAASYLSGIITSLPSQILPALVTQRIDAQSAAHLFLALMIVNLLLVVPQASNQTLFAAASLEKESLRKLTVNSLKLQVGIIVIPLIGIWVLGGWFLSLFGPSYVSETSGVLRILSLTLLPILVSTPFITRLKVKKDLKGLFVISLIGTIVLLVSSFVGSGFGLMGVAIGYVIGQSITCIAYLLHWLLVGRLRS